VRRGSSFGFCVHHRSDYSKLRKIIKTRGSFPTEEAALKLLYLALSNVAKKWETVRHRKQMLNHLDTVCADRIREAGCRL